MYKLTFLVFISLLLGACANENKPADQQQTAEKNKDTVVQETKIETAEQTEVSYPSLLTGIWKLTQLREKAPTKEQSFDLELLEDGSLLMAGNNMQVKGNWRYQKEETTEFLYIALEVAPEERPNKILSLDEQKMVLLDRDNKLIFERIE